MTDDKLYLGAETLLEDAFRLAVDVFDSGFRPDLLIALWRGGTPVGIAIDELFELKGVNHRHGVIKTRHYAGIESRHPEVSIEGLELLQPHVTKGSRILLVDDVFDTGLTLDAVIRRLAEPFSDSDSVPDIRIAAPWYKPDSNLTSRVPDYYLHETARWLVFPHELAGLTSREIRNGKPAVAAVIDPLLGD